MLEVALIKLCTPANENTQDSLLDRIRAVEEKVEKGIDAAAVIQAQGGYGAGYGQDSAYGGAGGTEPVFRAEVPEQQAARES